MTSTDDRAADPSAELEPPDVGGFSLDQLTWSSTLVGLAIAVTELALAIALAAIIFVGPLESALPRAAPAFVLSGGIVSVVVAMRSRLSGTIAGAQDLAPIVLLTGATSIAASGSGDPGMTMLVILAVSAGVYALALWAIDAFGLVDVVRFMPSTVVIGFVAGTGYLLAGGGLQVANASGERLTGLFGTEFGAPEFWVPCVLLGILIAVSTMSTRVPTVMIGLSVIGSVALFYAVTAVISSVDAVSANNQLIGPFNDMDRWRPLTPGDLDEADLGAVLRAWPAIAAAVFVSVIGVLLNLKGLEDEQDGPFEFRREIRSVSASNALVVFTGGLIGFHSLGNSTMARKNGVRGSVIPFGVGVFAIVGAVVGGSLVGYLPRFVAGGVLLGTGSVLLIDAGRSLLKLRSVEAFVGLAILAVVIRWGMLEGVATGLAGAVMIFLVRYSRIDPVRKAGNLVDHTSRIDRSPVERAALLADPDRVQVLRLQGYLFFGSVDNVRARVAALVAEHAPDCIVVDFRYVTGVDASALTSFRRMEKAVGRAGGSLCLAGAEHIFGDGADVNAAVGVAADADEDAAVGTDQPTDRFVDLDHALEWAEAIVLSDTHDSTPVLGISARLADQFVTLTFDDGDPVVSIGDEGNALFIIAEGLCVASLPTPSGGRRRLREFGVGSIVGEISFLSGSARTADIHAKGFVRLLAMDRSRYDRVAETDPDLIIELGERMLSVSADRVQDLSRRLNQELG